MQLHNLVYIQVNHVAARDVWIDFLNNNSIPLTNIRFLMIPCDAGSMRDCAPWFIWDGNNEMGIVNNTCWGGALPLDDQVPRKFAERWGVPYYEPDPKIFSEGGNFYPNGYGVAFCSTFVFQDNKNKSKAITDSLFRDYLGIEHLRTPAPSSIWHHDTWGKPANPETMIVVQWPDTHASFPVGEGMAAYYETLQSPWGGPYDIHRLPMFEIWLPSWGWTFKPYMNSVISNERVYVPITHSPDDQIALGVFQAAFPGYEIVGVDFHESLWMASLHCATKNIMRRDPIRIYPLPPRDTEDSSSDYRVTAEVIPPNGFNLLAGHPAIRWTNTGGAPFNALVMSPTAQADEYEAFAAPADHGLLLRGGHGRRRALGHLPPGDARRHDELRGEAGRGGACALALHPHPQRRGQPVAAVDPNPVQGRHGDPRGLRGVRHQRSFAAGRPPVARGAVLLV